MRILVFISIILASSLAKADSFTIANELGNLLASETYCNLQYNAEAIEKFVNEKVPEDDLSFAGTLQTMTIGNKVQLNEISSSGKIAHCLQTKRVAKSYGFID